MTGTDRYGFDDIMTPQEASEYLGLTDRWISYLQDDGILPLHRLLGFCRWNHVAELNAYKRWKKRRRRPPRPTMPHLKRDLGVEVYDRRGAADFLGVTMRMLQRWGPQGKGPAYRIVGHCACYTRASLIAWIPESLNRKVGRNRVLDRPEDDYILRRILDGQTVGYVVRNPHTKRRRHFPKNPELWSWESEPEHLRGARYWARQWYLEEARE